jgi:hypothetical protein
MTESRLRCQSLAADVVKGATKVHPVAKDGLRAVKVETGSVGLLRDLSGVHEDLRQTISFCEAYLAFIQHPARAEVTADGPDLSTVQRTVEDGLWSGALIAYSRAFGTGVRLEARLTPAVFEETEGAAATHKHFVDLRSKYVAHSVNSLEQSTVVAFLQVGPTADPDTFDVAVGHLRFDPLNEEGASTLIQLALIAGKSVEERIEAATETVRSELDTLGAAGRQALPEVEFDVPDVEQMGRRRP